MNKIGTLIRNLREQKGITQDFMAKELMLTQSNYGRLEKDDQRLNAPKLQKIAEILSVTVAYLFSEEIEKTVTQCEKEPQSPDQFYTYNRDIYESYINSQKLQIEHLQEEIVFLRELIRKNIGS